METDSFFYQRLKQVPETLFHLLGMPAAEALAYRFDAVELKKSLRIDGLLRPSRRHPPLLFVEWQNQYLAGFCAGVAAAVRTCNIHP